MVALGAPIFFGVMEVVCDSAEGNCQGKKKETNMCGSPSLEKENKEGNGRWRGRGKGIQVHFFEAVVCVSAMGTRTVAIEHLCWCHMVAVQHGQSLPCEESEVERKFLFPGH